jgi:hypothetical protein
MLFALRGERLALRRHGAADGEVAVPESKVQVEPETVRVPSIVQLDAEQRAASDEGARVTGRFCAHCRGLGRGDGGHE